MRVFLTSVGCVDKTTIGLRLAELMGLSFFDLDTEIEQFFDIIEQEPDRLLELEGIGPKRKERVTQVWAEQKVVRESLPVSCKTG